MGNPWEYLDEEETADHMRIATLGAVYGIAMLVEAMGERLQGVSYTFQQPFKTFQKTEVEQ